MQLDKASRVCTSLNLSIRAIRHRNLLDWSARMGIHRSNPTCTFARAACTALHSSKHSSSQCAKLLLVKQ